MDKNIILTSVKKLKEISPKRNFAQSFDLVINLQEIDLKKPEQKVDSFLPLHYSKGKIPKICALVDQELGTESKKVFDKTILKEEFPEYNDKKTLKKLGIEYDFFVAQANLMAQIAATFGKVLGPKGKMPNPKAGCIITPDSNLEQLKNRLQNLVHLQLKNDATIRVVVGNEKIPDEEIADNIFTIYNSLIHSLPQEKNNIKSILLKFTMGPVVLITDKGPLVKEKKEEVKEKVPKKAKITKKQKEELKQE